jgi:hypothetical protein
MVAAAGVAGAGAVGYGIGALISKAIEGTDFADRLGRGIAQVLAMFGNKNAQEALKIEVSVLNGNIVAAVKEEQKKEAVRN